jgi:hypothetical protein
MQWRVSVPAYGKSQESPTFGISMLFGFARQYVGLQRRHFAGSFIHNNPLYAKSVVFIHIRHYN